MNTKLVMGIVASLIVAGIGGVVTMTIADARDGGSTAARIHTIEVKVEKHDTDITKACVLLERIDERLQGFERDMSRRLDRVETKQDEALKKRK